MQIQDSIDFGTNCTTTLAVTEGFSDNGLSAFLRRTEGGSNAAGTGTMFVTNPDDAEVQLQH